MSTPSTALDSNDIIKVVRVDSNGVGEKLGVTLTGLFNSAVGYRTGAGGTVTQATSITTGVTLSKLSGQITTVSQTVAAGAEADFTVTNTEVEATDVVAVSISDHTSAGTFIASVSAIAAGSFDVRLTNVHASAAGDDTLTINFVIIKGASS